MTTIVIATGNSGKLTEIRSLLGQRRELIVQSQFNVPEAEETGLTFVENAILKARNAALHTGHAALGEDSGLEVDALAGRPGIYSARFAGLNASDQNNYEKLLADMCNIQNRRARYRCLAVLVRHADDPAPLICQGTWEGNIATAPRGDNGFGYDPLFIPADSERTAAELTSKEKNQASHRAMALQQLAAQIDHFLAG